MLLQTVEQFILTFQKSNEIDKAIDYLTNYLSYRFMCTHKLNNKHNKTGQNKLVSMLSLSQLHFLVTTKNKNLSTKQVNKVINLAIKNVINKQLGSFIVTPTNIYMAIN